MRGKAVIIILCFCMILSFCIPCFSQAPPEDKMRVAVVEFDEKGDVVVKDAGSIVAEFLVTSLGKIGKWEMVERVLLRDVLEEQGLGLTGVIDQETAAEIGKVYGVKRLIVGSVMRLEASIFITARLINTDNAQIIKTAEVETTKVEELRGKVSELASHLTRAYGTLVVRSVPSEAEVYLDGEYVAKTPVTLEEVTEGEHRLLLKKEGYTEKTELATVKEGEITQIEISLSKLLGGNIQVESVPPGARVYLDGTYRGESPLTLTDVSSGLHRIKLEKEGREDYEEQITVVRGKTITVEATLTELLATIRATSSPEGARIYIDEKYFGITPKYVAGLRPGTYAVKLTKPGYKEYRTRVFLTQDKTTLLQAQLVREDRPELKPSVSAGARGFGGSSLTVYGGSSMLNPSHYNNYLGTYLVQVYDGEITALDKLDSAISYGVDVRFGKNPGLLLSLGLSMFSGKAGFSWRDVYWGESLKREDTISVMGGLGSVLYALGGDSYSLYFGGGVGYYNVNLEKTVPVENLIWLDEYEYTVQGNQFGYHGLIGFQFFLSENIALGGEILYRVLSIPEMTFTEHDNWVWVGETWEHELNLGGVSILLAINIYV